MSPEVEKGTGSSRPTVISGMRALGALGAVETEKSDGGWQTRLMESERWLLDKKYRWALARLP